jgi:hypothetical protein
MCRDVGMIHSSCGSKGCMSSFSTQASVEKSSLFSCGVVEGVGVSVVRAAEGMVAACGYGSWYGRPLPCVHSGSCRVDVCCWGWGFMGVQMGG